MSRAVLRASTHASSQIIANCLTSLSRLPGNVTELLRSKDRKPDRIVYGIAAAGEPEREAFKCLPPLLSTGIGCAVDEEKKSKCSGADLMNFSWVALVWTCDQG